MLLPTSVQFRSRLGASPMQRISRKVRRIITNPAEAFKGRRSVGLLPDGAESHLRESLLSTHVVDAHALLAKVDDGEILPADA